MARKIFISVLGTGFYHPCTYVGKKETETRFIQQASLEEIEASKWSENDKIVILLTDKARNENWNKEITERLTSNKEIKPYVGLESILNAMNLPTPVLDVTIPEGNNEAEIWDIFDIMYNLLEDEDELYLDLTHGFRYLPMLVLVLSNYAKFLKKVKIKHVSYGNYEGRKENKAPMVDLLPFSTLQDWTYGAANFLNNGNVNELSELCKVSLAPICGSKEETQERELARTLNKYIKRIKEVVDDLKGCRAISLVEGKNIAPLLELSDELERCVIKPMSPILDKMKDSFAQFNSNQDVVNGYKAAKWCYDKQMYQQSLTILHENIFSHICVEKGWDWKNEKRRNVIASAFKIHNDKVSEGKWTFSNEDDKQIVKELFKLELFVELSSTVMITTQLRNDYNHAGIRENPTSVNTIIANLGERIDKIMKLFVYPQEL